jgi:protein SCO1/2
MTSYFQSFKLVICVLGLAMLAACDTSPHFVNTDITGSALVAPFKLKDLSGQERTLESYKGKVVAMFFGYTHCTEVCSSI